MLYLEKPKTSFVKEYQEKIVPQIVNKLDSSMLPESLKMFLTRDKITDIVISEHNSLIGFHKHIIPLLGINFTISEYNNYFEYIKIPVNNRITSQSELIEKYQTSIKNLKDVFDYTEFISEKKSFSYWIAEQLGVNTCVYCNRNYTLTIKHRDPKTNRENDNYRISRPQFDHWYSKSKYPSLALSIFNLIPSCAVCNSGIKGDKEFNLEHHVHPYDTLKENYTFSYAPIGKLGFEVKIKVDEKSKMDKTLQLLRIEELYRSHNEFELKDMIDLFRKYNRNYKNLLSKEMFNNFELSDEDIYRLLFGVDIKDYTQRPLSKFRHEIIEELRKSI